jgi:hypothetical protein
MESLTPVQQREVTATMARRTRDRDRVDYEEKQESDVGDSDKGPDAGSEYDQESDDGGSDGEHEHGSRL